MRELKDYPALVLAEDGSIDTIEMKTVGERFTSKVRRMHFIFDKFGDQDTTATKVTSDNFELTSVWYDWGHKKNGNHVTRYTAGVEVYVQLEVTKKYGTAYVQDFILDNACWFFTYGKRVAHESYEGEGK